MRTFFGILALLTAFAARADMIAVPAGPFLMGSDADEADERPAHVVDLPGFYIDRLPVTNAQFARFLDAVGLRGPGGERFFDDDDRDARIHRRGGRWAADSGFENHPAVEVSWHGAHHPGGGHDSGADELTTTHRGRLLSRAPRAGHHNIGFRCAR